MSSLLRYFVTLCLVSIVSLSFAESDFSAEPKLQGVITQGALIRGRIEQGCWVKLNSEELQLTPEGHFAFGFGRDADEKHVLEWGRGEVLLGKRELLVQPREYNIQYIEGVPQATVTPPEEKLARIREEAALVRKARAGQTQLTAFLQDFVPPMEAPITGVYGSQRVYNGTPKRPHFGVDYAAPAGTPVYAPADGKVSLVHADMYYSGGTLVIDHGYGVSSTFIHLSEVLVDEGENIRQGQIIAKVGKGGRATGPHLDWRMNWNQTRIDPLLVLELSALD